MSLRFRRLAIRLVLPLSWRLFPHRRGEILERFSATEADSAWHFLDALSHVDQPRIRARLFCNALEETHHAALFAAAARDHAQAPVRVPIRERVAIFDPMKGLQHFYAFVYVGEKDVYDQFDAYATAFDAGSIRAIFSRLKQEEDGHMQFAEQRLASIDRRSSAVSRQVRAIRRRRLLESWARGWSRVLDLAATLVLSATYFAVGPFARTACGRAQAPAPLGRSNGRAR